MGMGGDRERGSQNTKLSDNQIILIRRGRNCIVEQGSGSVHLRKKGGVRPPGPIFSSGGVEPQQGGWLRWIQYG
jgi:hypothetical protein